MASRAIASKVPAHVPPNLFYDFDLYAPAPIDGDVQRLHTDLLRDAPDIFYTPRNGGHWMAIRRPDVEAIMNTPELFSSRDASPKLKMPFVKISLPPQDMDAPDHPRYRRLLLNFMSSTELRKLEPVVRALTTELIDAVVARGECDFVADFAVPLPVKTFMTMMHMDLARYAEFAHWASGIISAPTMIQSLPNFLRMSRYLSGLIRMRKRNPGDDPVSFLLSAEVDGKTLTTRQVREMCNLLFLAGLDTVTNGLAFTAKHLAMHPEDQRILRENPDRIPHAVEEFLRRYAFVNAPRRVTRDTEFSGVTLKANEYIFCSLTAASNDDRASGCPMGFDLDRPRPSHLAFNTGPHTCAGAVLARMELRIFLEEWLRRVPAFGLPPNYRPEAKNSAIMALNHLRLRWTPGTAPN